ncbi:MAG: hypothetical protein JWQ63_2390 [Mucilaginibacter sp.]|nr:hypothetical protein [Mucilaginibacter sp.]
MHLAYSAINTITMNLHSSTDNQDEQNDNEIMLRYLAYQTVCNKYSQEIASIQKYIPNWMPQFRK